MFNMYPGTGMGASGMGTGSVGNLDPQKLAMLLKQLMAGGGAGGGGMGGGPGMPTGAPMGNAAPQMPPMGAAPPMGGPAPPPTPMPPQQAPNPFQSMQSMAGAMHSPMAGMPPGQPQTMAGGMQSADIAKLLASLQRGQSGVSPANAAGGPGLMTLIANLMHGRQGNGMPGAGMMDQLQQQAAGNTSAGAPGI